MQLPNTAAWFRAIEIAEASVRIDPEQDRAFYILADCFWRAYLVPFCEKYRKKFDPAKWEGWTKRSATKDDEYEPARRALEAVLLRPTKWGRLKTYMGFALGGRLRVLSMDWPYESKVAGAYLKLKEPFFLRYGDKTYTVTQDILGVGAFIIPHPAPDVAATVFELADLVTCVPALRGLANARVFSDKNGAGVLRGDDAAHREVA